MLKYQPCQGLELPLGKDIWTDSRGFPPLPLGLRIMQLGLELINLTIPSYLTKILIGHILYMVMTLRYLGAPIGAKSFLFGDNRSVVTSATLPHSALTKRHNIHTFHRVREAIASKLMAFYWIQSAYNLSDMLSKHWDHPTVYPMILKLLITRGNITPIPKEATQEKEKEI